MRLKFATCPPLPPLRAWTLLPPTSTTILSLKAHLYLQLHASLSTKDLKEKGIADLSLELAGDEGFELLDETGLDVLDPKVDVVIVRLRDGLAERKKKKGKRKAVELEVEVAPQPKRRRKVLPPPSSSPPTPLSAHTHHTPQHTPSIIQSTTTNGHTKANGKPKVIGRLHYTPLGAKAALVQKGKDEAEKGGEDKEEKRRRDYEAGSSSTSGSDSNSSEDTSSSSSSASSSASSSSTSSFSLTSNNLISNACKSPVASSSPSKVRSNPKLTSSAPVRLTPTPISNPVPPGHGSSATKGRNKRRRLGRKLTSGRVGSKEGRENARSKVTEHGTRIAPEDRDDDAIEVETSTPSREDTRRMGPATKALTGLEVSTPAKQTFDTPSSISHPAVNAVASTSTPSRPTPSVRPLSGIVNHVLGISPRTTTNRDPVPRPSASGKNTLPTNLVITSKYFGSANRRQELEREGHRDAAAGNKQPPLSLSGLAPGLGGGQDGMEGQQAGRKGKNRHQRKKEKRPERQKETTTNGSKAAEQASGESRNVHMADAVEQTMVETDPSTANCARTTSTILATTLSTASAQSPGASTAPVSLQTIQLGRAELDRKEWIYLEAVGRFEGLQVIDSAMVIAEWAVGTLIGWKAVVLDFATFTPELKLQIASLVSTNEEGVMRFRPVKRPADPIDRDAEWEEEELYTQDEGMVDMVEEGEEEEESEPVELRPHELRSGEYRLVRLVETSGFTNTTAA